MEQLSPVISTETNPVQKMALNRDKEANYANI